MKKEIDHDFFKARNIRTTNSGKICLFDLLNVTKNTQNNKKILELTGVKIIDVNGKNYIRMHIVLLILNKFRTKIGDQMLKHFKENTMHTKQKVYFKKEVDSESDVSEYFDESDIKSILDLDIKEELDTTTNTNTNLITKSTVANKIIDFGSNMFNYSGKNFAFIKVDNQIYFKGKEVTDFLEYTNSNKALIDHVPDFCKVKLSEIFGGNESLPPKNTDGYESLKKSALSHNEKNTIYITEMGLYELIFKSKKSEAETFKYYVFSTILPSIRENGFFSFSQNSGKILDKTSDIKSDIAPCVILDTSFVQSFYIENNISEFIGLNVVYLGIIGIYNGILIKFGKSNRVFDRDYKEHKKTFGDQFKIICVIHTDNNTVIEKIFKQLIKSKGNSIDLQFNGKTQKELFTTTQMFTINDAINELEKIAESNPLKAIKDRDDKIKELSYKYESNIGIEKEKTKQAEEKTKQLELEIRLLELNEKNNKSEILEKNENLTQDEIGSTLVSYFEFTDNDKDIVFNKKIEEISHQLNIKKSSIIEYLKDIGSTKYKNNGLYGQRRIRIKNI